MKIYELKKSGSSTNPQTNKCSLIEMDQLNLVMGE